MDGMYHTHKSIIALIYINQAPELFEADDEEEEEGNLNAIRSKAADIYALGMVSSPSPKDCL